MESGMADDYAMQLNRDAQVNVLDGRAAAARTTEPRVVFVTSHQAHFIRTIETMPEYLPVALSKRAGEDALRERIPALADDGHRVRRRLGRHDRGHDHGDAARAREPRRDRGAQRIGRASLYNVGEFAAEVALAAVEPIPADNTRYVGDVSDFLAASS